MPTIATPRPKLLFQDERTNQRWSGRAQQLERRYDLRQRPLLDAVRLATQRCVHLLLQFQPVQGWTIRFHRWQWWRIEGAERRWDLYAHTQYDVQCSYRVAPGIKFLVAGLNLSDEVFGFYQCSKQDPAHIDAYTPTL